MTAADLSRSDSRSRTDRSADDRRAVIVGACPAWADLLGVLVRVLLSVIVGVAAAPPAPAAATQAAWIPQATESSGQWHWPLDGPPRVAHGFQPPGQPWLAGHRGVDLLGSPGQTVRSAGSGRVSFAGSVAGKPVVVVTHAGGLRTTYEPVLAAVTVGQAVLAGAVIGRLSAAGHCSPLACLHWGLRRDETYLDPLALVGADLQVRLLPVWGAAPPTAARSAAVPPGPGRGARRAAAAPREPGRAAGTAHEGSLNKARASPSWPA